MKIAYAVDTAGMCGGVRVILEHCNRLAKRGHEVTLFRVNATDPRDWFPLWNVKDIHVETYTGLAEALKKFDGVKVATWWKTALPVARAGGGLYLVQDIETSYVGTGTANQILTTYETPQLTNLVEAQWVQSELKKMGCDSTWIGIGINHNTFFKKNRQRVGVTYAFRNHFLKEPGHFLRAADALVKFMPVKTFGLDKPPIKEIDHAGFLTDEGVMEQYNSAAVYLSTSSHEGFNLPNLEAMACGCPVVTTDADSNMEYCKHEVNCLIVEPNSKSIVSAIVQVMNDGLLRKTLIENGLKTAKKYQWDKVIDKLEGACERANNLLPR